MDSDWDSAGFAAGTLECLLCKETLEFVHGDKSDFVHHLMVVHKVKYHHNLLLSVTFLDNKTLNTIIKQFEKHSQQSLRANTITDVKDVVRVKTPADASSVRVKTQNDASSVRVKTQVDAKDENLLEENNDDPDDPEVDTGIQENINDVDSSIDDSVTKKKSSKGKRSTPNDFEEKSLTKKQKTNFFNDPENEIEFEYVLNNSEYFKNNPKQLTSKCNLDLLSSDLFPVVDPKLPPGWRLRNHLRPDGVTEKHFLAPDGRVVKSPQGVLEYVNIMEKYLREHVDSDDQENQNDVENSDILDEKGRKVGHMSKPKMFKSGAGRPNNWVAN